MVQESITLENTSRTAYRANHNLANQSIASTFSGPTAPVAPLRGQLWDDQTAGYVKKFNGTAWEQFIPDAPIQNLSVWGTGTSGVESLISPSKLSEVIRSTAYSKAETDAIFVQLAQLWTLIGARTAGQIATYVIARFIGTVDLPANQLAAGSDLRATSTLIGYAGSPVAGQMRDAWTPGGTWRLMSDFDYQIAGAGRGAGLWLRAL